MPLNGTKAGSLTAYGPADFQLRIGTFLEDPCDVAPGSGEPDARGSPRTIHNLAFVKRLEPDRLVVKAQLFINVGSSKPSLEPLLGS